MDYKIIGGYVYLDAGMDGGGYIPLDTVAVIEAKAAMAYKELSPAMTPKQRLDYKTASLPRRMNIIDSVGGAA